MTLLKSVLSVSLSSGATSPDPVEAVEEAVVGSISVTVSVGEVLVVEVSEPVVGGVLVPVEVSGVLVAACGELACPAVPVVAFCEDWESLEGVESVSGVLVASVVGGVVVLACGESVEPVSGVVVATGGASGSGIAATTMSKVVGVAALPAASLAVHVTVVVPTANVESEGGVHKAAPAGSTSSEVAGGLYETIAPESDVA